MPMHITDIADEAMLDYLKRLAESDGAMRQPSEANALDVDGVTVVAIVNSYETLAVYQVDGADLTLLDELEWPTSLRPA